MEIGMERMGGEGWREEGVGVLAIHRLFKWCQQIHIKCTRHNMKHRGATLKHCEAQEHCSLKHKAGEGTKEAPATGEAQHCTDRSHCVTEIAPQPPPALPHLQVHYISQHACGDASVGHKSKVSNRTYFSLFEIKDLIGFPSMTLQKCVCHWRLLLISMEEKGK